EQLRNQLDERDEHLKSQAFELDNLHKENNDLKTLISNSSDNNKDTENSIYEKQYQDFSESDLFDFFREIGITIRNRGEFPHGINEIIKEKFLVQNIVEEVRGENELYYRFTNKGLLFWKIKISLLENKL
ncbi:hypothetical protein, partial [Aurantibacter sp.]|uniref:hypothetical protein n=1 Tax=Aurantibacter sp. TaxID=2807103 RepID=UPI0032636444